MGIKDRVTSAVLSLRGKTIRLPGGIELPFPASGGRIDEMSLSGVWAAVRLVSGHLAAMPLNYYERDNNGDRRKISLSDPLAYALSVEASPGVTAFAMKEALVANMELHGVGYLYANVKGGRLVLIALDATKVTPVPEGGFYRYTGKNGKQEEIPREHVICFPSLTFDGVNPLHTQSLRERSMKLNVSYEERAAAFNRNSAVPATVVTWGPDYSKLSYDERERLRESWKQIYGGVSNASGTAFLPHGSSFDAVSFDPEKLQMFQGRQYGITEIARWFGVPPYKLADLSNSAVRANIEQQGTEYVQDALLPRGRRIEAIIMNSLIPESKRRTEFVEFNLNGLMRGDFKSRQEGYKIAKDGGWLSTNDIRRMENMNSVDGGDEYYMPLNMIPVRFLDQLYSGKTEEVEEETEPIRTIKSQVKLRAFQVRKVAAAPRRAITTAYTPTVKAAAEEIVKEEVAALREEAQKYNGESGFSSGEFGEAMKRFYTEFEAKVRAKFSPVQAGYAVAIMETALAEAGVKDAPNMDKFVADYSGNYSRRWVARSKRAMFNAINTAAAEEADVFAAVTGALDEWERTVPLEEAQNEPIRMEGGFSRGIWAAVGVTKLTWAANAGACPFCAAIDGSTVGIADYFVSSGQGVEVEGQPALVPNTNIGHPGLHGGCRCQILPG